MKKTVQMWFSMALGLGVILAGTVAYAGNDKPKKPATAAAGTARMAKPESAKQVEAVAANEDAVAVDTRSTDIEFVQIRKAEVAKPKAAVVPSSNLITK